MSDFVSANRSFGKVDRAEEAGRDLGKAALAPSRYALKLLSILPGYFQVVD